MGGDWMIDQDPADLCDSFDDYESDFYEDDLGGDSDYDSDGYLERSYYRSLSQSGSYARSSSISHPYTGNVFVGVKYAESDVIFYYTSNDATVKEGDTVRVNTPYGIKDLVVVKKKYPNTSTAPEPLYQKGNIIEVVSRGEATTSYVKPRATAAPSDKKYVYVGIRYSGYNKVYNFICDDWTVKIGDVVRVPSQRGDENVKVITRGTYEASNAPYPPSQTKHVISIVSRQGESISSGATTTSSSSSNSSGGCYIATCVYGSYDCPEVWRLRRYRDFYLLRRWWGIIFVKIYYYISPKVVKTFGNNNLFKNMWRRYLEDKVKYLEDKGYSDKPYYDR